MVLRQFATLAYLLLLVSVAQVYAQEMNELKLVGKPEFSPADIISSSKRDVNGDVVAGLMFITDLDNLSFEARNGVVSIDKEPGQYIIYVSTSERVVTVRSSGFKQLTIYLYDVGIRLKSGQMWKLEVTGTKIGNRLPVNVVIDKPDTQVFIDGNDVDYSKTISLEVGEHQIRIEKSGYRTIVETIVVSTEKTLFNYKLDEVSQQALIIRSNPDNAVVFIDDKQVGTTPFSEFRYPGIYQLKITSPKYRDFTKTIELQEDEPFEELVTLQKYIGILNLKTYPEDATVTLNKKNYSGQSLIELSGGTYLLEISRLGFENYSETIQVKELETYDKNIRLVQQKGSLQVKADLDATVQLIDSKGKQIQEWKGLRSLRDLPVDNYTLKAIKPGYSEIQKSFLLKNGAVTTIELEFTEQERLAFIEQQRELAEQRKRQKQIDEQNRIRAEQERKRKVEQLFRADDYAYMGFGYSPVNVSMGSLYAEADEFSFIIGEIDYDNVIVIIGFGYFESTSDAFYNSDYYAPGEVYGFNMNVSYGYGVSFGGLHLSASAMSQLVYLSLEGEDFDDFLDYGIGYKLNATYNFGGLVLGLEYSDQSINLADPIGYDRLMLTVGFAY